MRRRTRVCADDDAGAGSWGRMLSWMGETASKRQWMASRMSACISRGMLLLCGGFRLDLPQYNKYFR